MGQVFNLKDESGKKLMHDVEQKAPETLQHGIPIIDLASLDGPERQNICQQMAEACKTWGFFQLINHGIDQSLIERTKDVSTEFFHGPEEEKSKVTFVPQLGGWGHPKQVSEGHNLVKKDTVEYLYHILQPPQQVFLERVPQQPTSYKSTLLEYTKELEVLAEKLCGILSEMLGLEPQALYTALTAGSASQSVNISVRTNFYGLNEDGEALPVTCHAHSDPAGLSMLLADGAPGLEVRKDGKWVKVKPIPGSLIVNIGDMLELCSNGTYKSVEHRGMPSYREERLTLAMFQLPNMDAVLRPIGSLLNESHPPLYKTTTWAAYFVDFFQAGLEGKSTLERYKV